ncbi:hypothetical protein A6R79_08040 [Xanthomonas translucens pv. translucens]|nr:hypothetical protein A6R79_08040 [Xanthomonas translucens pv. translucens]CCP39271.1 hypothetical protein BN444_00990 [Xanthomonas translucens pv. translucens DSM 18974]
MTRLYALGPLSAIAAQAFGENGRVFDSHAALIAALRADLRAVGTRDSGLGTREEQDQEQETEQMHENTGAAADGVAPLRVPSPESRVPASLSPESRVPATLLIKGSRGSAMDKIVSALLAQGEGAPHAA